MDYKFDFDQADENHIVYVRPIAVSDLPAPLRSQIGAQDTVYAVCSEEGERLALVQDRKLAFLLARQHDLEPVTVH